MTPQPKWLFLLVFVLVGVWFAVVVPVGWNADELAHMERVDQIARGGWSPEALGADGTLGGGEVSVSLQRASAVAFSNSGPLSTDNKAPQYGPSAARWLDEPYSSITEKVIFSNSALYSPLAYVPAVPAIWIGESLGLSVHDVFLLARVFSLLAVAAAFYGAIAIVPYGKWALACIGLVPTVINQAASVSSDPMLIAMVVLTVAVAMRLILDERAGRKWIATLTVLTAAVGLVKGPYVAVAGLLPLVMIARYGLRAWAKWLVGAALMVLAALPTILWTRSVSGLVVATESQGAHDTAAKIAVISVDPVAFVGRLFRTYLEQPSDPLWKSVWGDFVWLSAPVPISAVVIGALTLLAATGVRARGERRVSPPGVRVIAARRWMCWGSLVCVLVIALAVTVTLWLTWSPYPNSQNVVVGPQGRYFTVLLPFTILILPNWRFSAGRQSWGRWLMIAGVLLVLMLAYRTVDHRLFGQWVA